MHTDLWFQGPGVFSALFGVMLTLHGRKVALRDVAGRGDAAAVYAPKLIGLAGLTYMSTIHLGPSTVTRVLVLCDFALVAVLLLVRCGKIPGRVFANVEFSSLVVTYFVLVAASQVASIAAL